MPVSKLNSTIIEAAIIGFEHQKTQIDSQIAELRAMLNGSTPTVTATPEAPAPKRKKFSAAAIQRMREAQQRRWARVKGEATPQLPAPAQPQKPQRKLSAAAKAKLVANLKKARAAKAAKAKADTSEATPARKKGAVKKAAEPAAAE